MWGENLENRYEMNAKVFKAFCDENRLMIIEMLQNGEKCACHENTLWIRHCCK